MTGRSVGAEQVSNLWVSARLITILIRGYSIPPGLCRGRRQCPPPAVSIRSCGTEYSELDGMAKRFWAKIRNSCRLPEYGPSNRAFAACERSRCAHKESTGSRLGSLFKSMLASTGRGCPSRRPTRIQSSSVDRSSSSHCRRDVPNAITPGQRESFRQRSHPPACRTEPLPWLPQRSHLEHTATPWLLRFHTCTDRLVSVRVTGR